MTEEQVGEERVHFAHSSIGQFVIKGSEDRNSSMTGTWRQELINAMALGDEGLLPTIC